MLRKVLLILLLLLGAAFLLSSGEELEQVVDTLLSGDPRWLGLALLVHLTWMLNIAASFRAIYRLLGVEERIGHLMLVAAAAQFVSVVAPSGGMGGMAVLLADGRKRGLPSGRVTTGAALFIFAEQASLLAVVALGLAILFQLNQLSAAEVLAALILAGIALFIGLMLLLGLRSPELLRRVLAAIGGLLNRMLQPILKRDYLELSRVEAFSRDVNEGLQEVRQTPKGLLLPAALAFSSKALLISILSLVFIAFRQPFSPGTLIAAFSIGYLFYIVSPTPSGIGFVEGAMTLVLSSLRVPLPTAAVIAIAFRGITFWLTILYGMAALRWIGLTPRQAT
jgi:uncharacterized protein (TIRG00374 family)